MLRKIILHILLLIVALPFASPQSGTLVSSFGDNGISRIDFDQTGTASDVATIIKFDTEGRIIVCGTTSNGTGSAILRLNPDNSLDSTFGINGKLIFQNYDIKNVLVNSNNKILLVLYSGGYDDHIVIKQLNSDGNSDSTFSSHGELLIKNFYYIASYVDKNKKFLLLGNSYVGGTSYFNIIRFNSDGSFDNTYGTNGKLVFPLLWPVQASLMVANDKLLIGGTIFSETNKRDLFIMRLNSDGSEDSTFNINGKLIIQNANFDHGSLVTAVDRNGRILIGGASSDSTAFMALHILRLNDNGTLDSTLQVTGRIIIPEISGYIKSIQFDSYGKILVGDYDLSLVIAKLNDNGSLDSTFGTNGKKSVIRMNDFVVDSNDKILLAGNTEIYGFYDTDPNLKHEGDFKIIRLDSAGATDSTFANSGELVIPVGNGYDEARCMAFDGNDKIILAGYSIIEGYNLESSIARINADGSMDSTFSGDGKEIFTGSELDDYFIDIKTDLLGRILIVGNTYDNQNGNQYGYVKRLKNDGSIDSSFNPGLFNSQGFVFENVISFPHNNKILLAYHSGDSRNHGIIRLNEDGHVDSTFNQNGVIYPLNYFSFNVTSNAEDQIIAAGAGWINNHTNFQIIRFNYDGSIDSTFNGTGKQTITDGFDFSSPYPNKIIIDENNKILVTGFSGDEHNLKITLARLNTDGSLDSTFGNGGIVIKPGFSVYRSSIPTFSVSSINKILLSCSSTPGESGFIIERMNQDGSADTTFGHLGKIRISDGYCLTLMADSNYIWMAGAGEWDYKILKLFARNNQHIIFDLADTVQFGDLQLKLSGTASSGLPVIYASSNPSIASIIHDTLYIKGPGSVMISASQGGDGNFYAAQPVIRKLVVKSNITSIPTPEPEKEIKTYPNPVSNILSLESPAKIRSVTITGLEGNIMYKNNRVNNSCMSIDLSGFKAGCYLITIQLDDNSPGQIRKIIKL